MASQKCGKTKMVVEGLGSWHGPLLQRNAVENIARQIALSNAQQRADHWIQLVKCAKRCSAKSYSVEFQSISTTSNYPPPQNRDYVFDVKIKLLVTVDCKDLNSIKVTKWEVSG